MTSRQPVQPQIDPSLVRASLARILLSTEFERSERARDLLRFVVESTLDGNAASLKESVIGARVFERDASYDPKIDPVVRVTVGRLRTKLDQYYAKAGAADPIRIEIGKGSYVPVFRRIETEPVVAPVPAARRKPWAIAGVAVLVLLAALVWFIRRPVPPSLDGARPLVAAGGRPLHPSISPSGDLLAFDWNGPEDRATAVYVQPLEGTTPKRLTTGQQAESWPVWSPDGKQIAFLREKAADRVEVVSMPLIGGGERVWFEVEKAPGERPRLDWSPDGKWFATAERKQTPASKSTRQAPSQILLLGLQNAERRLLTQSPADWRGDSEPVFSPDSREVAFRRTRPTSGDEDIFVVPIGGGEPRQVTFDHTGVAALVYTPDHGILFSSRRFGWLRGLWWLSPDGGAPRRLSMAAYDLGSPAVSRDGRHLAYVRVLHDTNIWRLPLQASEPRTIAQSEFTETAPAFSPDGRKIAFISSRSGSLELWTADISGANAVQLTRSGGDRVAAPQWSPDGSRIAFEWRLKGREGVYLIPAGGGTPNPLVTGKFRDSAPRWSRDGRHVYFNSNRSGSLQVWRVPAAGGEPVAVTRNGGSGAVESEDGSRLYYSKAAERGIWSAELKDGQLTESLVVPDVAPQDWGNWAVTSMGIYFVRRSAHNVNRGTVCLYDPATRAVREIYSMKAPPLWNEPGLAVSPDGQMLLFAQVDQDGTSIFGR